ncbi:hypothetical protein N7478_006436 [Penicillium angulare]|uniref:uncharacterized protein n=1 Tax=Penicillium angulare TaxID=116970 RepID=UPI002541D915|nr:uncharacterized protein N7478_006436 [Penicillium angulare]KAJ5281064.1 hypothetical protein N7478_006436 [Penicillium angulare]
MSPITRLLPRKQLASLKPTPPTRCIAASSIRPTRQIKTQPLRSPRTPTPTPISTLQTRSYHSSLHPSLPPHAYTNSQIAILEASLTHVPTHGFTHASLTLGARDAGFLDVSVQLFPRGEFDLILFYLASRRGLLRAKIESSDFFREFATKNGLDASSLEGKDKVDTKIKMLILERLRMNEDIRDQWQDALAQMSLLGNIPLSLAELHALSNDILNLAGDESVDASWYTRRAAVGAIYASAEVVMTRDPTGDMSETAEFVERRFEDRDILSKKVEVIGQCFSFWGNTVLGVGRSYGLKV